MKVSWCRKVLQADHEADSLDGCVKAPYGPGMARRLGMTAPRPP